MRPAFKVIAENLSQAMRAAQAACMGDKQWLEDCYQQMWVEAAFLEDRHGRTQSPTPLDKYILRNLWDRIRIYYEKASNVVEPPTNRRVIKRQDDYSDHCKAASEAAMVSKAYEQLEPPEEED